MKVLKKITEDKDPMLCPPRELRIAYRHLPGNRYTYTVAINNTIQANHETLEEAETQFEYLKEYLQTEQNIKWQAA